MGIGEQTCELHCERVAYQIEIKRLRAENEALKINAERYLWLRDQDWNRSLLAVVSDPKQAVKLGYDCPSRDRLDALVDALRGEGEK